MQEAAANYSGTNVGNSASLYSTASKHSCITVIFFYIYSLLPMLFICPLLYSALRKKEDREGDCHDQSKLQGQKEVKHLLLMEVGGLLPTPMGSRVIKYSSRFGGGGGKEGVGRRHASKQPCEQNGWWSLTEPVLGSPLKAQQLCPQIRQGRES